MKLLTSIGRDFEDFTDTQKSDHVAISGQLLTSKIDMIVTHTER